MGLWDAPVKVSPLIRASRWGLLCAGIFYGIAKKKVLIEKETPFRAQERLREIEEDERFAREGRKRLRKDILDLVKELMPKELDDETDVVPLTCTGLKGVGEENDGTLRKLSNMPLEQNVIRPIQVDGIKAATSIESIEQIESVSGDEKQINDRDGNENETSINLEERDESTVGSALRESLKENSGQENSKTKNRK